MSTLFPLVGFHLGRGAPWKSLSRVIHHSLPPILWHSPPHALLGKLSKRNTAADLTCMSISYLCGLGTLLTLRAAVSIHTGIETHYIHKCSTCCPAYHTQIYSHTYLFICPQPVGMASSQNRASYYSQCIYIEYINRIRWFAGAMNEVRKQPPSWLTSYTSSIPGEGACTNS